MTKQEIFEKTYDIMLSLGMIGINIDESMTSISETGMEFYVMLPKTSTFKGTTYVSDELVDVTKESIQEIVKISLGIDDTLLEDNKEIFEDFLINNVKIFCAVDPEKDWDADIDGVMRVDELTNAINKMKRYKEV